jgi:acyl-CoA reductase-like NAD-dependent aldehyde dehydrogenase
MVKSVADKFLSLLKSHAQSFDLGTAASTRIAETSIAKLADAERKGAKFIPGGLVFKNKEAAALQTTIITSATSNMDIFDEESFGPSLIAKHSIKARYQHRRW